MRARTGVGLVFVAGLVALPALVPTAVAQSLEPCRSGEDDCARVTVQLDRSGAVAGAIQLHVELDRATSPSRPPLLAIGGLQGQASSEALSTLTVGNAITAEEVIRGGRIRAPEPARDVIAIDLRGTGKSGALRCAGLERSGLARGAGAQAAACAAALGPRRGFFTARDSAEDVEAVRKALGVEKIALLGVSYGARVALTYAQRHPGRVERMVLQSPPPPEGDDLLYRPTFAAIPAVVAARCGPRACRAASKSPVADVTALARRLDRGPIGGRLVDRLGRRRAASFGAFDLFEAIGATTSGTSFLVAHGELTGFVRNALRGDAAPLLRVREIARWYRSGSPPPGAWRSFSSAAHAASVCEESVLPWERSVAVGSRDASAMAVAFETSPDAFMPFGPRTALQSDLLELCRSWPVVSPVPDPPRGVPAVPALIMAAEQDLTAPLAHAEAVARLIPGAHVLPIPPGYGFESDLEPGSCAASAVQAFLADGRPPARCGRPAFGRVRAPAPPPLSLSEVDREPGTRGRAGRTLAATRLTLRDGARIVALRFFARVLTPGLGSRELYGTPVRTGALRRGTYRLGFRRPRFALGDASYVPGIRVSGWIAPPGAAAPSGVRGRLRVHGAAAARGRLTLRGRVLSGRLGGRPVRSRLLSRIYPDVTFGR